MFNLRKLLLSFKFAFEGIVHSIKTEQNIRFHLLATMVVMIAGLLTGLDKGEWIIIFILIGGMLSLELINTAIERVVDLVSPGWQPLAKQAKDAAAGAVLVFATISAIIGILIFLPKWF
ncbi:diacylglycerol kinase family protein [Chungangia koreensis]|uniref:Diacylglycerol kinase family protein n=1 Tax=Chungangia koreensis TaxID=752657 RepID=A0ABV8X808_9LACT